MEVRFKVGLVTVRKHGKGEERRKLHRRKRAKGDQKLLTCNSIAGVRGEVLSKKLGGLRRRGTVKI